MTTTGVRTFDQSLETTREWLQEVQELMGLDDEQRAFRVMRAVLQTLRDRLTVEAAAKFAAQLPMLLQGVYYHGWTPAGKPIKIRNREEFLARVARACCGNMIRRRPAGPSSACSSIACRAARSRMSSASCRRRSGTCGRKGRGWSLL